MKKSLKFLLALIITLTCGCGGNHLISNKEYLAVVEKSFNERKGLTHNREAALFSVFNHKLSIKQKEALKFLFAFMPLNDLADYNGDFFLANIDMSLHAKSETPWGKNIPEEIFLHYVLPCRVNNENLDSFRIVYYDEILDRIRGKDIREAALEINHWCHEKVTYQPADIRTSAPMSTILSARGRCGEESTFTVAALRTAGISARQVYTPRWAHSDDNHAWIEIWYNGDWYYMGACEPEPVLDRGWFTEPARRAMLVNTKSFGAYWGDENVINKHNNYTEVNNLAKYAVTKKIYAKVLDKEGAPLNNAKVEYQLYNYAEFYPLAVVPTNENGISQFETGLGDLLIWSYKNDDFDYKKISVNETDTLILKLNRRAEGNYSFDLDLDVPVIRSPLSIPTPELIEQNSKRIDEENIIRQKYIDSWMKPEEAKTLALKINTDSLKIMNIIARSMGNYNEIRSFLSGTPDSLISLAVSMLEILPDKDLRDLKGDILSDHLGNSFIPGNLTGDCGKMLFLNYILNPRIANEIIVAWRSYFKTKLSSQLIEKAYVNPLLIVQYLNENIKIADDENYYKTPLTPIGVNELKVSDKDSRSICFVAICRSLGVPSRLEPGRNVPQYFLNGIWNDVYFADQKQPSQKKGYLKLISTETKPVPEYYIHFTIARFESGRYNTLEYDPNKKINDFKEELPLPPGNYMLVTGNRLNDSKILSNISFFDLSENEHKTIEVKLRRDNFNSKLLGKIDLKKIANLFGENEITLDRITDKGVAIIWTEPDKEPTKHIFNDLPLLKRELDSWGGYFLFLSVSKLEKNGFRPEELNGLPTNTLFGTDNQMAVFKNSVEINKSTDVRLPYVVLADKNGNILFTSTGYRIGIGEQILKHIKY
ncbi:MAG: transglutaminase domain-containing protein [Bacteroidia bacterium]|nr:transglutaminase domain-containing protein [Bacteroidia bacterium]